MCSSLEKWRMKEYISVIILKEKRSTRVSRALSVKKME